MTVPRAHEVVRPLFKLCWTKSAELLVYLRSSLCPPSFVVCRISNAFSQTAVHGLRANCYRETPFRLVFRYVCTFERRRSDKFSETSKKMQSLKFVGHSMG